MSGLSTTEDHATFDIQHAESVLGHAGIAEQKGIPIHIER
jgi:hypothetical protein